MAIVKYKEGTLDGFENGFSTKDYTFRFYKSTVLSEDGTIGDFTEATGTNYVEKSLLWASATVSWNAGESKYEALWPQQIWTNIDNFVAEGWYIVDSGDNRVYSAEALTLGSTYDNINATPSILLG